MKTYAVKKCGSFSRRHLDFLLDKVGRYWAEKAGEIDIVAIDTMGRNLMLVEYKYTLPLKVYPFCTPSRKNGKPCSKLRK